MNILERIIADKMPEIERLRDGASLDDLMQEAMGMERARPLGEALVSGPGIALIAEIKRASPSRGRIREDFHPAELAEEYEAGGAAALSVLTEANYFEGHLAYLAEVRAASKLPVLRKDFLVDARQVPESRLRGADAVLLIVAALDDGRLREMLEVCRNLSLAALVEVHTEAELDRALGAGATLVGINNRDLETFEVNLQTTFSLLPRIPEGVIKVSESGIGSPLDVALLRDAGADAILVGEWLMRQDNVRTAVRSLMGGQRSRR